MRLCLTCFSLFDKKKQLKIIITIFTISFLPGTRIVYERAFLMNLKNSPLSKTPPSNLNLLPHNIIKGNEVSNNGNSNKYHGQKNGHGPHGHSSHGHFHHGHPNHGHHHIGVSPLTKPMTNMSISSQRKTPPKFDDSEQFDMDL